MKYSEYEAKIEALRRKIGRAEDEGNNSKVNLARDQIKELTEEYLDGRKTMLDWDK